MLSERQEIPVGPDSPRCEHCGGVIGVYEPYIIFADNEWAVSSRAAEPVHVDVRGVFHLDCYEQLSETSDA
jgi:hypothetical protein